MHPIAIKPSRQSRPEIGEPAPVPLAGTCAEAATEAKSDPGVTEARGLRRLSAWMRAHPTQVTVAGSLIVAGALVVGLWDKRDEFAQAFTELPVGILVGVIALQVLWLILRSEAWHVCVGAAGGSCGRLRLYRAAAVGYLGNIFNANFGLAVRIAALRRTAPADSPRPTVLVAAEMPIIVIEIALAALMSFTLVGPLGVAWWIPFACLAGSIALGWAVTRFARHRREGVWKGLAVMRGLRSRNLIILLVILAVSAQAARNLLVLQGIGVDVTLFDSIALLIATAALGILPVGPSLGAAAAVLILGSSGVAAVAAGGALLTATGAAGSILFATWALLDRLLVRRSTRRRERIPASRPAPAGSTPGG